jgi:hypothetical protein
VNFEAIAMVMEKVTASGVVAVQILDVILRAGASRRAAAA